MIVGIELAMGEAAHRVCASGYSIPENGRDQNLIISALVNVDFADNEGALSNVYAVERSA
jgi:hypothetical protein